MKKTITICMLLFAAGLGARPLGKLWKVPTDVKPVEVIDGHAMGIPVPPDASDVHGWQECSDENCSFALTFKTNNPGYIIDTETGKPQKRYRRIRGIKSGCTGDGRSGGVRILAGETVHILHPCRK